MVRPHAPFQHRDCVMGVTFVLDSIRNYPGKELPQQLVEARAVFRELEKTLQVDQMPKGALRDIDATVSAITDGGGTYSMEDDERAKRRGWVQMWLSAVYAFQDARNTCPAWVEPHRALWDRADSAIDGITATYMALYPKQHQAACRTWCCHASPHARPELEEWINGKN